jgi:2-polyprenyl-6-methoxyphenol hydroxylase-like FAD-dependent oxidoreductase
VASAAVTGDVLVVGAGVSGLVAALAFEARGYRVTVLDRDSAVPAGVTAETSWDWPRRGAPHVQHPHFLMGRLRMLMRDEHPDLLQALFAAGVWELPFIDTVHPAARRRYRPEPGDSDLVPLCARRTTFELVVRKYIEQRELAEIRSGAHVDDLIVERPGAVPTVTGCTVTVDGDQEAQHADVVVMASGRGATIVQKQLDRGCTVDEEHHRSQSVYYTRHYRLRPGSAFPALTGLPGVEFPDLTLGALPADNGTFTVTLAVWKDDSLFAAVGADAELFEQLCGRVPKIAAWIDPERAEPLGGIARFAAMDYLWRHGIHDAGTPIRNLFLLGDAAIRTNPKFGRGCTWGSVAAHRLADIVATTSDPLQRAARYDAALWNDFRSDWETLRAIEERSRRQFEALVGRRQRTVAMRLGSRFGDHVMNVAMSTDSRVQRAVMRGYHGLDGMADWTRSPRVWLAIGASALPTRATRQIRASSSQRPSRADIATLATARS